LKDDFSGAPQNWQHNAPPSKGNTNLPQKYNHLQSPSIDSSAPPLPHSSSSAGSEKHNPPNMGYANGKTIFTHEDLANATEGFSLANLLCQGGFGYVHKGVLPSGETRMLVYEFVPNNTFKFHLHGTGNLLDWDTRMKIALGYAKGLAYLHEDCQPKIIHRDIKSANILLDKYALTGKLTEKSDVFLFGVMLLELITERRPIDKAQYFDDNIVDWARPLLAQAMGDGDFSSLVDTRLKDYQPTTSPSVQTSRNSSALVALGVGIGIGGAVVLVFVCIFVVWYKKRKRRRRRLLLDDPVTTLGLKDDFSGAPQKWQHNAPPSKGNTNLPPKYNHLQSNLQSPSIDSSPPPPPHSSREDLANATEGFSPANLLGQGGFGYVHKGVLPSGKTVAIKQLKTDSGQGMKITLGSAKGLAYLHEDCQPKIIHRDIKSANILLDSNFKPKDGDFGLSRFTLDTESHVSTRVMGTFGYLALEYALTGKLTEKSDVFSFGVMLPELITERRPIDKAQYLDDIIVDWARPLLAQAMRDGDFSSLVDTRLQNNLTLASLTNIYPLNLTWPLIPSKIMKPRRLKSGRNSSALVALGVWIRIGGVVVLVFVCVFVVWYKRRKIRRRRLLLDDPVTKLGLKDDFSAPPPPHSSSSADSEKHNPPNMGYANEKTIFTHEDLANATEGFSLANLLGQGGFGYVHKGVLLSGKTDAIKQLKTDSGQGEREFQAEVAIISRDHHKHLVSLVGYCTSGLQRMLVYEFVPNNTFKFHLHGKGNLLDWDTRMKIALGSAKGLAYLHEDCQPKIIHRDIKSANILLDSNFETKVANFGLARFTLDTESFVSTRVMGTFGYLALEYAFTRKLTEKSDVFSFGVMLLELITERRPNDKAQYLDDNIVDWARPLLAQAMWDGDFSSLVDTRLQNNLTLTTLTNIYPLNLTWPLMPCKIMKPRRKRRRWRLLLDDPVTTLGLKDDFSGAPQNWQHNAPPSKGNTNLPPKYNHLQSNLQSPSIDSSAPPPPHSSSSAGSEKHNPPNMGYANGKTIFTHEDLANATKGFSPSNLLGQGGFGYVHKGVLPSGETVGYYTSGLQRMLVYEFVPNNTFEFHLHEKGNLLDWDTRMKIVLGFAKGLAYLHEDCQPKIIQRDIKSANILFDSNFEPKDADFALSRFTLDTESHVSTRVVGTFSYLAPEYALIGKLTEKSDVFSFGVMLLELITERQPIDKAQYLDDNIVDWARPLLA
nr:proline-rich receptor-like protein kinase PERK15 [Tanacetum cinerariifolium]